MLKQIYGFFHGHYHRRYHGIYNHAKQLFVFDLALLGLALGTLGLALYLMFWKPGITDQIELNLALDDRRIKSGENVTLKVNYYNRSKFRLNDVTLGLRLPPSFIVNKNAEPPTILKNDSTVSLPPIEPGGSGSFNLSGTIWTTPNTEDKILALLSYTPESVGRREQKIGSLVVSLPDSVLESAILVATSSFPGQILPITLSFTNNSDQRIENIRYVLTGVRAESELITKELFDLKPKETITIKGKMALPTGGAVVNLRLTPHVTINENDFNQKTIEKNIAIISPNISASGRFLTSKNYADANDELPVEINWKNNTSFPLSDARIRLKFTPGVVDVKTTARLNKLKTDGQDIIIDKTVRTQVGEQIGSDVFTVRLVLLPLFDSDSALLTIEPIAEAEQAATSEQVFRSSGKPISINLATQFTGTIQTRYYTDEGDQLGRGPLPPRVGETTKYWIFVHLRNTVNKVENISFTATLPSGVTFTNKQSVTVGPELKYQPDTNTITWSYPELPAGSQTGLYFEVAFKPTPEQAGKEAVLLSNPQILARDSVTGKTFDAALPTATIKLPKNDRGSLKGGNVIWP